MNEADNPFDTYHLAPLSYDKDGLPVATAPFTSKSDLTRHAIVVPPSKVIPIIFVPGIMGSNLKLVNLPEELNSKRYVSEVRPGFNLVPLPTATQGWGAFAWRPDDASFMARKFVHLEAYERRRLLNPDNTEVDDSADFPDKILAQFTFDSVSDGRNHATQAEQRKLGFVREMKRRGWGSVMLSSYGPLLSYLEKNLNQMYWRGELNNFWTDNIINRAHVSRSRGGSKSTPSDWGIIKGDKSITVSDVKKASRSWLPVHAVGYNWLKSNRDGGVYLSSKIDEFISHYKNLGYACDKSILITHSMGGLVARASIHSDIGKAEQKVTGVVHGVMPTNGAAAAYRRCKAGFETSGISLDSVAAYILGSDGPEVAAVFSNSPGALELLPNKRYGTDWLQVKDHNGTCVLSRPQADPYSEIYAQKDAWWRLMNPAWLDPRPDARPVDERAAWAKFLYNLSKANGFHESLGDSLHPHTHFQYGVDPKEHLAFGTVTWQAAFGSEIYGDAPTSQKFIDDSVGTVTLSDVTAQQGKSRAGARFQFATKDEAGDGTVPLRSASALDGAAEMVARHAGYDHQSSYLDSRAQELVAYSVARLVSENES